jgi:hypothetical protein
MVRTTAISGGGVAAAGELGLSSDAANAASRRRGMIRRVIPPFYPM